MLQGQRSDGKGVVMVVAPERKFKDFGSFFRRSAHQTNIKVNRCLQLDRPTEAVNRVADCACERGQKVNLILPLVTVFALLETHILPVIIILSFSESSSYFTTESALMLSFNL